MNKIILALIATFLIVACGSEDSEPTCTELNCINGDCINDACNCLDFFEGTNCDTTFNMKYVEAWNMDFVCKENFEPDQTGSSTVNVSSIGNSQITFNLHSTDLIADIDPSNSNAFTIQPKNVDAGGFNIIVSGGGSIENETLTIITQQSFIPGVPLVECTLIGSK